MELSCNNSFMVIITIALSVLTMLFVRYEGHLWCVKPASAGTKYFLIEGFRVCSLVSALCGKMVS